MDVRRGINMKYKLSYPAFLNYVISRIEDNKNALINLAGATGIGKSWAALWMAQELSKKQGLTFNPKNICFRGSTFLERINTEQPAGSVIIFDEIGVSMGSRQWQSELNRLLSFLLQTFRYRRYIILFTLPSIGMLDTHARQLLHISLEHKRSDLANNRVCWKPFLSQLGQRQNKVYWKYLRVKHLVGSRKVWLPLTGFWTEKPSDDLVKIYEKKKKIFADALLKDIQHRITEIEEGQYKKKEAKPLTEIQEKAFELFKQGLPSKDVAKGLNRGINYVNKLRATILRKGWTL